MKGLFLYALDRGESNVQREKPTGKEEVIKSYSSGKIVPTGRILRQHEAILHVLDRELPGDEGEIPKYYPKEPFAASVASWEGIPLIFERNGEHADLDKLVDNKEAELKRVGAFDIGVVGQTWIEPRGRSKLMGMLNIRDPEDARSPEERTAILDAERLFDEGKLSISTGFYADAVNDGVTRTVTGGIRPNHLLLFEESDETGALPRDLGSQILNKVRPCQLKQRNANMPNPPIPPNAEQPDPGTSLAPGVVNRLKTLFSEALSILNGKTPEAPDEVEVATKGTPKVTTIKDENTQEREKVSKELEAQVNTLKTETATLKETNTTLENDLKAAKERLAKIDADAEEQKWNNVKAHLEVGRIDTPEKIAAERLALKNDPVGYMLALTSTIQTNSRKKEGSDAGDGTPDPAVEKYTNAKKASKSAMRR